VTPRRSWRRLGLTALFSVVTLVPLCSIGGTWLALVASDAVGRWIHARRLDRAMIQRGGRAFHVARSGSDAADGRTPATAWQTLARASRAQFLPGDTLRLAARDTFIGPLLLGADDGGDPRRPVVITSNHEHPATIRADTGDGLRAHNPVGLTIEHLRILGREGNAGSGIMLVATIPGVRAPGTIVRAVDVASMHQYGIRVYGWWLKAGLRDVVIQDADVHDNVLGGVAVDGIYLPWDGRRSHRNVRVEGVRAWNNRGDPTIAKVHSGSGIIVSDVDSVIVRRSVAWGNGSNSRGALEGPYGIWSWHARHVIIEQCVSFANRTGSRTDGGGFDLDGGTEHAQLRDVVSMDNDGPGLLLAKFALATPTGDLHVDRMVSVRDARRNSYGAVTAWGAVNGATIRDAVLVLRRDARGAADVLVIPNQQVYPWERSDPTGIVFARATITAAAP
jgi:hypothetical protein